VKRPRKVHYGKGHGGHKAKVYGVVQEKGKYAGLNFLEWGAGCTFLGRNRETS